MKHIILLIVFFWNSNILAADLSSLDRAVDFFSWLEKNTNHFAQCSPQKKGRYYQLCDGTQIDQKELRGLFRKKPQDLLKTLRSKGLKVEILCDLQIKNGPFQDHCIKESKRKTFKEIKALHGKYLPQETTILIRSSATPGSLIHEYVHHLQSQNTKKVFGKVYKKERNLIQLELTRFMDERIQVIQALEKKPQKPQNSLKEFMIATELMRGFAPWQDLIDERGIFLLYLKFGKEFGVTEADLDLAKKNMKFICQNPKLKNLLPSKQCNL